MNAGGIGMLIGMGAAGEVGQERQHAENLAAMRAELSKKLSEAVYQTAFKEAAASVQEEIIEDLRRDARLNAMRSENRSPSGTQEIVDQAIEENERESHAIRLSDPKNVDGRNTAYADRAAESVRRISGGQIIMSRVSIDKARKARVLK